METRERGIHNHRYFLYDMLPICFFGLFPTTLECSFRFCTDFLPQLRHQFDVDIRLEERRANLFQECIQDLKSVSVCAYRASVRIPFRRRQVTY